MRCLVAALFVFVFKTVTAQNIKLKGKVEGAADLENIHVVNSTQNKNTTTNAEGVFSIGAKVNDTLKISSIQYKNKEVVIAEKHLASKEIVVALKLKVNVLDEVFLKQKKLTGNLLEDINNSKVKRPINFYDVGIPGYTGKPLTQSERRLRAATRGGNLNALLNLISGRTKRLKEHVRTEVNLEVMRGIKSRLFEDFLKAYPLKEDVIMDFFYFCLEDVNFENRCKEKSDLEIMAYLGERYKAYRINCKLPKN